MKDSLEIFLFIQVPIFYGKLIPAVSSLQVFI